MEKDKRPNHDARASNHIFKAEDKLVSFESMQRISRSTIDTYNNTNIEESKKSNLI